MTTTVCDASRQEKRRASTPSRVLQTYLQDVNVPLADLVVNSNVVELHVHPQHCMRAVCAGRRADRDEGVRDVRGGGGG